MGLGTIPQDDFSAGAFPGMARDEVPTNGFEDGINCLIDDDGLPYRRGGSSYKSNGNFSSGNRFIWDGYLAPGQRTLIASATKFGVLDSDDATVIDLANGGLAQPLKAAAIEGLLFLPGGKLYGGARLQSSGSIGNVGVTLASQTVTGANFNTNARAGQLFTTDSVHYYAIEEVTNDNTIKLAVPFREATNASIAASVGPFAAAPKIADIYLAISNRILACINDRVYESVVGDSMDFTADEYHQLAGGTRILGAEASRDVAIIFTTAGVWAISGTAFDLTDADGNPQQRLEQISRDLILWSWAGIATWGNSLVVPAVDGVWLVDSVSAPSRITGGMATKYRSYVDAGYHTGFATVFNNHYFLPVLDSNNAFVDLLSCRLVPTRRGRGTTAFGWTRHDGDGANMIGITVRAASTTARNPYLIGGHRGNGRICKLSYFTETAATAADADGSAHVWEFVTREFITGGLVENFIKKLRARFELVDSAAVNPTLSAAWAEGDDAYEALSGAAPEADLTDDPYPWKVGKTRRAIHFRLRSAGAAAKCRLHSLELFVRPSARR